MNTITGLNNAEVLQMRKEGKCNKKAKPASKSYKRILFENIFTVFNIVNAVLAVLLFLSGSVKNCLFMIVVISNTFIGIIQEIRAKKTVDKLSIINTETINVIRNGNPQTVTVTELVLGDVISIGRGEQVPNDCTVLCGNCEVNESLLTGESDPVTKKEGDELLSGSYIIGGKAVCKITAAGRDNYADTILRQIKRVKQPNSEIVQFINKIILIIAFSIIPIGGLLFYNQYTLSQGTYKEALTGTATAVIGMIPEGLILLTSTVFAVGVIRLSKKNVLSQDLYSLESLARIDVLCLDKTGTITTGKMQVSGIAAANGFCDDDVKRAMSIFAGYSEDNNSVTEAIKSYVKNSYKCTVLSTVPFTSERKWSAITTEEYGTLIMGAKEMIFTSGTVLPETDDNYRNIAFAVSAKNIDGNNVPNDVKLIGYVKFTEELRSGIEKTFDYFTDQGVEIKVISGDSPETVKRLCSGIFKEEQHCIDMSKVCDEDIEKTVEENTIFGRVSPEQKRKIITALKKCGHKVGMVGDGVNDVLALKESDCSAAPVSGSSAARNTARLVLLNSDLRSLADVVAEGRRSINNLQKSASLFFVKTIFSAIMSVIFMITDFSYPLEPIQMTLVSALTIGFPSFILSFLKNNTRIKDDFLKSIAVNSLPAALTDVITVVSIVLLSETFALTDVQVSGLCVISLAVTGIILIINIYKPLTRIKLFVTGVQIIGFVSVLLLWADFFNIAFFKEIPYLYTAIVVIVSIINIVTQLLLSNTIDHKK